MNKDFVINLMISSGVLGLIGWALKKILENAMKRWTDRIEWLETGHEDMKKRIDAAHTDIDDLRDKKVDRVSFMQEAARTRMRLERLLEGQARIEGRLGIPRTLENFDAPMDNS